MAGHRLTGKAIEAARIGVTAGRVGGVNAATEAHPLTAAIAWTRLPGKLGGGWAITYLEFEPNAAGGVTILHTELVSPGPESAETAAERLRIEAVTRFTAASRRD